MFIGKPEGKRPLGNECVDRRLNLERNLKKQGGRMWIRIGISSGLF
jgi:hypothetical protein